MTAKLITPPSVEPITVEEAKIFLRIDTNEEESLISSLISAARMYAEKYTCRSFLTQEWELSKKVIAEKVYLPYPPVEGVVLVSVDGNFIDDYRYTLVGEDTLYFVSPIRSVTPGGIVIRYAAGYGNVPEDVPRDIRQAILITVAGLYENRESGGISAEARELLKPYRVFQL